MTGQSYLQEHTINEASVKKFTLEVQEDKIIIPVTDSDGKLLYKKERLLTGDKKFHIPAGVSTALFNSQAVKDHPGYVVIAGGEIDCVRLDQEGLHAVSSTGGEASFKDEWIALVKDIPNIFLCLDNDKAGEKATAKIAKLLPQAKVVRFPEGVKDVCEYFKFHSKNDYVKLMEEARVVENVPEVDIKEDFKLISGVDLLNMEFEDQHWIIDRFISVGGSTIIVGESGSGKSYVLLAIIKSLLAKEALFDKFEPKMEVNILVIDKENGLRRIKKRMQAMDVPFTSNLYFLATPEEFRLDNKEGLEYLADFIKTNQIGLILIDSLIDIIIGNENSSVDTTAVFNGVRSIANGAAFGMVHHDAKPIPKFQKTAGQKTRGSSNILAQVDNQFYIEKQKDMKTLYIEQGKSRDFEPVTKFSVEFQSNEQGEMTGFQYVGEVQEKVKQIEEAKEFLFNLVSDKQMVSKEELIESGQAKGLDPRVLQDAIRSLKKGGLIDGVRQPGQGNKMFYILVEGGDNQ